MAPNARSYYACDQCGYRYNVRRTRVAELASRPLTIRTLTAVLLAAVLLLVGAPAVAFGAHEAFYREAVQWLPPWHWPGACAAAFGGGDRAMALGVQAWRRAAGPGAGAGAAVPPWMTAHALREGGCDAGLAVAAVDATPLVFLADTSCLYAD